MAVERHLIVATSGVVRAVAMDSITHANSEYGPGDVLIGASFAGIVAVQFAARFSPRGVIAHDCGVGRDGAGISGLWFLEGRGIPAVAVDSSSARIADGLDTWNSGVVSVTNHWAALLGITPGDTVQQSVERMFTWDGSPWADDTPRERRTVMARRPEGAVVAADSIRFALPEDRDNVVCVGSHGGLTAAAYALEIGPRGFISSDGGIGREASGVAGLRVLDEAGIPGAAVSAASARIGDGASIYLDGIVSTANDTASRLGVRPGLPARDAALLMLGWPDPAEPAQTPDLDVHESNTPSY